MNTITSNPNRVADDVLLGILMHMTRNDFSGDARRIHKAMFELRGEFRALLTDFAFSKVETYPFSRTLERALARLQLSRFIGMENPDFDKYIIHRRPVNAARERILARFNAEEQNQLEQAAREFEQMCGLD